jgi:hypothetical protein
MNSTDTIEEKYKVMIMKVDLHHCLFAQVEFKTVALYKKRYYM